MTQTVDHRRKIVAPVAESLSGARLSYWPSVFCAGDMVEIRLYTDDDRKTSVSLRVELLSEQDEVLLSEVKVFVPSQKSPHYFTTSEFSLPQDNLAEGSYILRVINNYEILDSVQLDVFEDSSYVADVVRKMKYFTEGLTIKSAVLTAIEFGNYDKAIALQKKVANSYISMGNQILAAKTWEELAEKLFELKAFKESKEALEQSLALFKKIEDLADKDEILKRLTEEIEICLSPHILSSVEVSQNPYPGESHGYQSDINKKVSARTKPKKKNLWDDLV